MDRDFAGNRDVRDVRVYISSSVPLPALGRGAREVGMSS